MALADDANRYIDDEKPWVQIKEEGKEDHVQAVCTQGLNLFRVLIGYLAPVLPFTADEIWQHLPGGRVGSVFLAGWYDGLCALDAETPSPLPAPLPALTPISSVCLCDIIEVIRFFASAIHELIFI